MITTRKEMKEWLRVEAEKLKITHFWVQYLTGSEFAMIYSYMWILRHLELYEYKKGKNNVRCLARYKRSGIHSRNTEMKKKL